MPEIPKEEINEMLLKYKEKLKTELELGSDPEPKVILSREYVQFKKENMPAHLSIYEQLCNQAEKIFRISPDKNKEAALWESINTCHLNATPTGVVSFAILAPIVFVLITSMFFYLIFQSAFLVFIFVIVGIVAITPLQNLPHFTANNWRMKASNHMVLSIFYVVTYMRHTSNLENAIEFASEHLAPPLSLDLKKIIWDVETEKYDSIKESLDAYLETWKKWNSEFVEAFHLIESSLYEGDESRRLTLLDKSLDVILDGTYERMMHYAQELKNPITMLHMLGIILPILGLVILPLMVSFMEEVKWYHIAMIYDVLLPFGIYYLSKTILARRPTGYGDSDISETNPELRKYKNVLIKFGKSELKISPLYFSIIVGVILLLLGASPLIIHSINPDFELPPPDPENPAGAFVFLDYRTNEETGAVNGPFGIGASVLSICVTLAFGLSVGIYYKIKSKNLMKIRENSKKLEQEFASALFQLGNRLGDGLPAEIAFTKVASTMEGTASGSFFGLVSANITKLGVSVKEAIFNRQIGALIYFPSSIIESSMKVLVQSVKKGPQIAAQSLTNISRYVKEIHKVNERLKDLLADTISSMKAQVSFLTPVISGIVVGITSMITLILGNLSKVLTGVTAGEEGGMGSQNLMSIFGQGIPTYYFQIIIGVYVVEIIFILSILINGIENGSDKLGERDALGRNLVKSTITYAAVSLIVMLIFNFIGTTIMAKTMSGM